MRLSLDLWSFTVFSNRLQNAATVRRLRDGSSVN